jgi:hypothetical protein
LVQSQNMRLGMTSVHCLPFVRGEKDRNKPSKHTLIKSQSSALCADKDLPLRPVILIRLLQVHCINLTVADALSSRQIVQKV